MIKRMSILNTGWPKHEAKQNGRNRLVNRLDHFFKLFIKNFPNFIYLPPTFTLQITDNTLEAPFHKAEDDSVVDATGKIVFYSTERFAKEIAEGNCCFICGVFPDETQFNNEHVIPKWILRRFNLYERSINLPNGTTIQYDQYTVPCCADCNTFLGETFEKPIQQLIDNGTSDIEHYVKSKGPWLIFLWMALIFLKTHLKDRTLRNSLDHREADGKIADLYEWENLHHIHCIV